MSSAEGQMLVVGLNSGTSMDGVDAILIDIHEDDSSDLQPEEPECSRLRFEQIGFLTHPYPAGLKGDLLRVSVEGRVEELCVLNVLLGKIFASAAEAVVVQAGKKMEQVSLIGSHGQTIHHLPTPRDLHGYTVSSTLQIGDPSVIANQCGVTTVGDFRMADISVGGQGAPLVPYFDGIVLHRHFKECGRIGMMLNIGGISNISAIQPGDRGGYTLIGFDCGPGNVLVDMLSKKWYGKEYDEDGQIAKSGKSSSTLLDYLMEGDEFILRAIPKSTGREHYNEKYLEDVLEMSKMLGLSKEDCMATITEFTASAVSFNFEKYVRPRFEKREFDLFVCGGGARNKFMMDSLGKKLDGVTIQTSTALGVDPDAKEAFFFAVLAYQTYKWRKSNPPSVTGAKYDVVQGKICPSLRVGKQLQV